MTHDDDRFPIVLSNDYGIRPAGRKDECFYCHQKVGTKHKAECVMVLKKIKAKYIFEIELEVPYFWNADMFEFHHNESSWCASNAVSEIQRLYPADGESCPCGVFKAEYVSDVVPGPYSKEQQYDTP